MSENPPLTLRPTSIACRSISGCRNGAAKTSSFPLCPDHRPGPTLLKNSHSRSSQKFHRARMPYKRRSRFWWTFSTLGWDSFFKRGGFSTSLTTSVSSSVFAILSKTLLCDRRVGSPTDALSFDNFVHTQPNGSALFRHVGGVDPPDISPITMDHDDLFELPPFGEAGGLFSHPVTALAGPLLKSGIPAWASPLCRSFPRRQNSS